MIIMTKFIYSLNAQKQNSVIGTDKLSFLAKISMLYLQQRIYNVSVWNKCSHEDIQWYDMYTLVYLRFHERIKWSSHVDYSMDQYPPQGRWKQQQHDTVNLVSQSMKKYQWQWEKGWRWKQALSTSCTTIISAVTPIWFQNTMQSFSHVSKKVKGNSSWSNHKRKQKKCKFFIERSGGCNNSCFECFPNIYEWHSSLSPPLQFIHLYDNHQICWKRESCYQLLQTNHNRAWW